MHSDNESACSKPISDIEAVLDAAIMRHLECDDPRSPQRDNYEDPDLEAALEELFEALENTQGDIQQPQLVNQAEDIQEQGIQEDIQEIAKRPKSVAKIDGCTSRSRSPSAPRRS